LAVFVEMLEVGLQGIHPLGQDGLEDGPLVVGCSLSSFQADGASRAFADAGPEAIAGELRNQSSLAIDELERSFRATSNAESTTIT